MIEKDKARITDVELARQTGLKANTISKQYMNVTSEFAKDRNAGGIKYGGIAEKGYINNQFKATKGCLDEKFINKDFYTQFSVIEEGKSRLAGFIKGTKSSFIKKTI